MFTIKQGNIMKNFTEIFTNNQAKNIIVQVDLPPKWGPIVSSYQRQSIFIFGKYTEKTFKKNMSPIFFFPFVHFTDQTKMTSYNRKID